jgi:hypothetical protein
MRRPERQPQRSLRQSASVVSSPPLYRMCHNVPDIGILADKISVSLTTKRVNHIVTRHAAPFCTVLAVGAPQDRRELGDVAAPSSGPRSLVSRDRARHHPADAG